MNLYELAHHPDAWSNINGNGDEPTWWGSDLTSTKEQYETYLNPGDCSFLVSFHTDENEFRMHLLFVHWATTEDVDMEGECQ